MKRKPEKKSGLYGIRTLLPLRYRCSALPTKLTSRPYNQLPVGLLAQLVERCTGIAEVILFESCTGLIFFFFFFSGFLFTTAKVVSITAMKHENLSRNNHTAGTAKEMEMDRPCDSHDTYSPAESRPQMDP